MRVFTALNDVTVSADGDVAAIVDRGGGGGLHARRQRELDHGPVDERDGPLPATGSVAALISRATGVEPYFVGKPNPMMMRSALNTIEAHSESTAMIGDRMDTDVLCGLEAGLETILVLTGISTRAESDRYPYRPSRVVDSVADLIDEI